VKIIAAFLLIFVTTFMVNAQTRRFEITELGIFSKEDFGQAKVYLNQEAQLNDIIVSKAHARKSQQVWRVRIYIGSGKNARTIAQSTRNTFVAKYSEISADMVYPSPYWKVLVGNFKTRIEAESFKRKLSSEYPNSRVELINLTND
jgi:hypothetical protein